MGIKINKKFIIVAIILIIVGTLYFFTNQNRGFIFNTSDLRMVKASEIVELKDGDTYNLTASVVRKEIKGKQVKMLAYNGSIPGPLIKITQNAEVIINFKNDADIPTTLHSHGVRLDNKFDGVVDVTQKEIPVGGTFTYKVKFPDAGIFWYHPHFREDYAQELGLYGNYLVTSEEKDYWAQVDREEALFLDDILIENGEIAPFSKKTVDHTLMGRFGNVMLINGEDNYTLSVRQGERVRLYLTNAASTRVFNIVIPGTRIKLVGSDNGRYEREEWVESVMLGPSERQIVEIWFNKAGNYQILHKTPEKTYTMGIITVKKAPVTTSYLLVPRENEEVISEINALRPLFMKHPEKTLNLTLAMIENSSNTGGGHDKHMMGNGMSMDNDEMHMDSSADTEKIEWEDTMNMMNTMSTTKTLKWKLVDEETNKENMDISWQFKKGDKVKIRIFNDLNSQHPMQHPIHIHGQRFLVLSSNNGTANNNLAWKDTVLVQKGDWVDILVDMENLGDWMLHCHIPEHMEAGMMTRFKVI